MTHRSICAKTAFITVVVLAFALTGALATDVPDLTVDQILDRYVEAVGGEEAIKNITSRECMGKVTTDLTARDMPVFDSKLFRISAKVTGKYLFEELIDGPGASSGSDGLIHWSANQCGITSSDRGDLKVEFLTDPQGPLRVKDYFAGLTHKGTYEINGKLTYRLEPSDLKPEYYTLYFDVETGLLSAIGYHWFIEEYREFDGVLFAVRFVAGRKGGATKYDFSSVKNNVELDERIFSIPTP